MEPRDRSGNSVGDADAVVDQATAVIDEATQSAHRGALGLEAGELVGMAEEQLEDELGVGGVVLGAAGGEGLAVSSHGGGLDGEEDEKVVLEQGGDDGALAELQGDGDGRTTEALSELVGPGANSGRSMRKNGAHGLVDSRDDEADVVLLVGPVDADKRCELRECFLQGGPPVRWGSETCRAGPSEGNTESRWSGCP